VLKLLSISYIKLKIRHIYQFNLPEYIIRANQGTCNKFRGAVIIPLYAYDSAGSSELLRAAYAQVLLSVHRLTVTSVAGSRCTNSLLMCSVIASELGSNM